MEHEQRPGYDVALPAGGYAWWYVDAASGDGAHLLTVILFVGNPFSPFYARALRGPGASAVEHCATNVVLYSRRGKLWTFTEWAGRSVSRESATLRLGSSIMAWAGGALEVRFDQTSPLRGVPLVGQLRLHPDHLFQHRRPLDLEARHLWWPIAPSARVEVTLSSPPLRFSGTAYHDMNVGLTPLAEGFDRWDWCHADLGRGAAVLYQGVRRDGTVFQIGEVFGRDGRVTPLDEARAAPLGRTRWGLQRQTRVQGDGRARVIRTLESSPFYARSQVATELGGQSVAAMHETMDLRRFRSRLVRPLFYLRMQREVSWSKRPRLGVIARLRP